MRKAFGNKLAITAFLLPALSVYILIVILPIFASGYISLLKWDGIGERIFVGAENYIEIFKLDGVFLKSVVNSLMFACCSLFIQLPIALLLALILARGIKGENFFRTVYFIPVIISTMVIGQLWIQIFNNDYGLLNYILKSIGLESMTRMWLADPDTALGAVFVPNVWQYIGYHMLLMYAYAKSIPEEIYEAARIDGASEVITSIKITIPLMKPILQTCAIFALIGSLKVFDLIWIITKGGPLNSTEVPTTWMYTELFLSNNYGTGSAAATFIVVECLLLTIVIQKAFSLNNKERTA